MEAQPKDIGYNDTRLHDVHQNSAHTVAPSHQGVMMPPAAAVPMSVFDEFGTCMYCQRRRPGSKVGTRTVNKKTIAANIGATTQSGGLTPEQAHNVEVKKLYVEKVTKPTEDVSVQKQENEPVSKLNGVQWKQGGNEPEKEIVQENPRKPTISFNCPRYF